MNTDRDLENILRSAMRDETERIEPADHLQDIMRRTQRPALDRGSRRRRWVIGIAGAGLVAASVTTVVWVIDETGGGPHPQVARVLPPVKVPVYYVQDNGAGKYPLRIFPEQHQVSSAGNTGLHAVSALFTAPPTDPDYSSLWASGSVDSVTQQSGLITVDLSADAAPVGNPPTARVYHVALQQIVYTVQQALDSHDPVRIMISGSPPEGASEPLQADPARVIEGAIVIDTPSQDATVQSPVTVEGDASVFEATVSWQILQDGQVVQEGYTTTSSGQKFSPYSFDVDLDPGSYTLRVYEASAEDGSPMFVETKQFTVE
jgi:Immunoglobulin-like domain of bacterial spore germination/Sporulation and spore germination